VVVDHFNVMGVAVSPHETDSILIVDPDAMLALPISTKGLEVVARKGTEVAESLGCVQLKQLPLCDPGDAPKPARRIPKKKRFGIPVSEGPNHVLSI